MNKPSQYKNKENPWDQAIQHLEEKVAQLGRNDTGMGQRLRAAIGTFKAHRDAGFEWPGRKKAETVAA